MPPEELLPVPEQDVAESASPNTTPIDGIEILVTLARSGKIDPWNVDIVEVTDQYLQILGTLKSQDLKLTGKTLLYAAILLRMKSDSLSGIDFLRLSDAEGDAWEGDDFLEDDAAAPARVNPLETLANVFKSLDDVIRRRTSVKQPRNRKVTLDDLIIELKKYEELEKQRRLRETVEKADKRRMRNYTNLSTEEIVDLTHEEFVEDRIFSIQTILQRFFENDEDISLTQLEKEGQIDRVSAYLAVLFLVAQGGVDLRQEQFYSELYMTPDRGETVTADDGDEPLELAG